MIFKFFYHFKIDTFLNYYKNFSFLFYSLHTSDNEINIKKYMQFFVLNIIFKAVLYLYINAANIQYILSRCNKK